MLLTNCLDLARRASSGEFENAGWFVRLIIRLHMAICWPCRKYRDEMKLIAEAAGRKRGEPDPAYLEAAKSRVLGRLKK